MRFVLPTLLAGLVGCQPPPAGQKADSPAPPTAALGTAFDPAIAGTVRGRVTWSGDVPKPPALMAAIPDGFAYRWADMPNPFAPVVGGPSRGLAGAVVYLKAVDPAICRPWDLPPAEVILRDYRIAVRQGGDARRVGFVRAGDAARFVSADPVPHMLRARGAAYFTLPFPDPDKPLDRRLDKPGLVELTSGAGYFWAAADLFVCPHPYYAVTDPDGRFTLPAVPAGTYELVCWVRNWHVAEKERDPETGLIFRQRYAPPVEKRAAVTVGPKQTAEAGFTFSAADFAER